MRQETLDATVTSISSKAAGAGSVVTVVSWWQSSNLGMWAGILIGVLGLLVNWYYKHRSNARADAAHNIRMRAIEAGISARALERMGKPSGHHEADE
jgi:hypothetical protein